MIDFDKLTEYWDEFWAQFDEGATDINLRKYEILFKHHYPNLNVVRYDADQSKFFKFFKGYDNRGKNLNIMTEEMAVIREQEGW